MMQDPPGVLSAAAPRPPERNGLGTNGSCYFEAVDPETLWDGPALSGSLPALVYQMAFAMGSNLLFLFLLGPLKQPRIVRDIMSGLVVSPFVLKPIDSLIKVGYSNWLWPKQGMANLESIAYLGLVYAVFIKGIQIDTTPISNRQRGGGKTFTLILGSVVLPFIIAAAVAQYYQAKGGRGGGLFKSSSSSSGSKSQLFLYFGAVTASGSFDTLASTLAKLKLLCTDIGRDALSMGMINDLLSWLSVIIIMALSALSPPNSQHNAILGLGSLLSVVIFTVVFGAFCFWVIRTGIKYAIKHNPDGDQNLSDSAVHVILFMVMGCGVVAELCGAYSVVGAFMLGLSIPRGHLASVLVEKMEDCVSGILMPLFFALVGTEMTSANVFGPEMKSVIFKDKQVWVMLGMGLLVKPVCVFLFSTLLCGMKAEDGLAMGVTLNSKGIVSLVIAVLGLDHCHLSEQAFTVLVLMVLLSTVPIGPIMWLVQKRMMAVKKRSKPYNQRTVEGAEQGEELRVVACLHDPRNIPGVINLVELSNVTQWSPMSVFGLHLIELIGRASTMLISHDHSKKSKSSISSSSPASSSSSSSPLGLWLGRWLKGFGSFFDKFVVRSSYNRSAQFEHVVSAFDSYDKYHHTSSMSSATTVSTLTIISHINTMHEDISTVAEDKQAALIILPFHKQQGMDGKMEDSDTSTTFRSVNQNLICSSPCSVALLVDRGIGMLPLTPTTGLSVNISSSIDTVSCSRASHQSSTTAAAAAAAFNFTTNHLMIRIGMLYFGGPDDREALTYACRLAAHPYVSLTVIRFLAGEHPIDVDPIIFPEDDDDDHHHGKIREHDNGILTVFTQSEREKKIDDEFIAEFLESIKQQQQKHHHHLEEEEEKEEEVLRIEYAEVVSNSGDETVAILREMDHQPYSLYVVGRGKGVLSPLTAGLAEWSDNPELGAIGDVLVTSDFAEGVSVVVVQKYARARSSPRSIITTNTTTSSSSYDDALHPHPHHHNHQAEAEQPALVHHHF